MNRTHNVPRPMTFGERLCLVTWGFLAVVYFVAQIVVLLAALVLLGVMLWHGAWLAAIAVPLTWMLWEVITGLLARMVTFLLLGWVA